ncbi:MAG TPA: polysaccharide deacetylase family protein [Pyrinomonadaceae bacterium]|nr:polysaccharide deacetylase family protein [Pyrinomonadaceae bacterium]
MNRREFTTSLGIGAIAFGLGGIKLSGALPDKTQSPRIAITMDDFNWNKSVKLSPDERNKAVLQALKSHGGLKAALFVAAKYVDNDKGKNLLREWDHVGHMIGNHSYSHTYLNSGEVTTDQFTADILKGEAVLKDFPRYQKSFRFPFLKEGETAIKRDDVRKFLKQQGYRNGHVTIDASDWAVENRLSARLTKDPTADVKPYRDFYLEHMWERALYYDDLSRKTLSRSVKHTILVHFNLLNALFLGDLLDMFQSKGWKLIDAAEAFKDPVFSAEPKIVPAGESIIWALAKETGKFDLLLRYPGEDSQYENAKMDKLGL